MFMPLETLFNIGDYVLVDNYKRGYIIQKIKNHNDEVVFSIKYDVMNNIEYNVSVTRCVVINYTHSNHTRSGLVRNNWLENQNRMQVTTTNENANTPNIAHTQVLGTNETEQENNHTTNEQRTQSNSTSIVEEFKISLMHSVFPVAKNNNEVDAYCHPFTGTQIDFCTCAMKTTSLIVQFT